MLFRQQKIGAFETDRFSRCFRVGTGNFNLAESFAGHHGCETFCINGNYGIVAAFPIHQMCNIYCAPICFISEGDKLLFFDGGKNSDMFRIHFNSHKCSGNTVA